MRNYGRIETGTSLDLRVGMIVDNDDCSFSFIKVPFFHELRSSLPFQCSSCGGSGMQCTTGRRKVKVVKHDKRALQDPLS